MFVCVSVCARVCYGHVKGSELSLLLWYTHMTQSHNQQERGQHHQHRAKQKQNVEYHSYCKKQCVNCLCVCVQRLQEFVFLWAHFKLRFLTYSYVTLLQYTLPDGIHSLTEQKFLFLFEVNRKHERRQAKVDLQQHNQRKCFKTLQSVKCPQEESEIRTLILDVLCIG